MLAVLAAGQGLPTWVAAGSASVAMFRAFPADPPHSQAFPVRNPRHPCTVSKKGPDPRSFSGTTASRGAPGGIVDLCHARRSNPLFPQQAVLQLCRDHHRLQPCQFGPRVQRCRAHRRLQPPSVIEYQPVDQRQLLRWSLNRVLRQQKRSGVAMRGGMLRQGNCHPARGR